MNIKLADGTVTWRSPKNVYYYLALMKPYIPIPVAPKPKVKGDNTTD